MSTQKMSKTQNELADHIRDLFIVLFRGKQTSLTGKPTWIPNAYWDGGRYKGRQRKSIWPQIAAFVTEQNLFYPDYLNYVIRLRDALDLPTPNHLLSPKRVAEFRSRDEKYLLRQLQVRFELDKSAFLAGHDQAREYLVGDPDDDVLFQIALRDDAATHNRASPLFRYYLAWKESFHDIAEELSVRASIQYLVDADRYDLVWGEFIPAPFRRRVRRSFGVLDE